jgi:hypothetical protein
MFAAQDDADADFTVGIVDVGAVGVAWLEGEPKPGQMKLRALFTPRSLR